MKKVTNIVMNIYMIIHSTNLSLSHYAYFMPCIQIELQYADATLRTQRCQK